MFGKYLSLSPALFSPGVTWHYDHMTRLRQKPHGKENEVKLLATRYIPSVLWVTNGDIRGDGMVRGLAIEQRGVPVFRRQVQQWQREVSMSWGSLVWRGEIQLFSLPFNQNYTDTVLDGVKRCRDKGQWEMIAPFPSPKRLIPSYSHLSFCPITPPRFRLLYWSME